MVSEKVIPIKQWRILLDLNPLLVLYLQKITLFDEKNFAIWKRKTIVVLEIMEYNMMDIFEKIPHIPNIDETKDGVSTGVIKRIPKHQYIEEDKKLINVDVHARTTIGNSLPYDIYHLT